MDYNELNKMTVKALREEAGKNEEITGASGMKKDELVDALCKAMGIEKPKKEKKAVAERSKVDVKKELKKHKELRLKALESNDKKELKKARFHIKRLKREIRGISA